MFLCLYLEKNKVAPNRYAATPINPFKSFNNKVGKIIPGFSLTQEQFESDSISINLWNKNLSDKQLSEFLQLCTSFGIAEK